MKEQELQVKEKTAAQQAEESTKTGKWFVPHVDIYETDSEVTVIADMPGVSIDAIDVSLEDEVLTLMGHRAEQQPGDRILLEEYETGNYLRRFTVAETIDRERIHASLTDGVLKVSLPKATPDKPRKIDVKIG